MDYATAHFYYSPNVPAFNSDAHSFAGAPQSDYDANRVAIHCHDHLESITRPCFYNSHRSCRGPDDTCPAAG